MQSTRPLILLTNDDGIHSPGLLAAAEAVCDLGDLLMVAPSKQQSGMGRGIPPVIHGTVTPTKVMVACQEMPAFALDGSPAFMVLYGVLVIAPHVCGRRPDLVISGINHGENLGTCVTSSGTVGAALQAADMGILGLAASLETDKAYHFNHAEDVNWTAAAAMTRLFAQALLTKQLPFDVDVLKIDVPSDATLTTSWRLTRQARQAYYVNYPPAEMPLHGELAQLDYGISVDWEALTPDTDIYAFGKDRVVAVTPLSQELTSRTDFGALERLLKGD